MDSKPALVLLGALTLFLGGVVGGVLGSALIGRTAVQPGPAAATPGAASTGADPELVRAIEALLDEVRRAGDASAPAGTTERRPVGEVGSSALEGDRVVEALDRLTQALRTAQGRAAPGGIGITPLVLPAPGSRQLALQALIGRDWEEISSEYRFLTFQQVLDRFGRPDEVDGNRWTYYVPHGDGQDVFTFQFSEGYLMNIYD